MKGAVLIHLLVFITLHAKSHGKPIKYEATTVPEYPAIPLEDLNYALIPLLIGINAVDMVKTIADGSTELKFVWQSAIVELNDILHHYHSSLGYKIHLILDETVEKAQNILSPLLKSTAIILNLLSNATTINGINTVIGIVDEQIQRLFKDVAKATALFEELFTQTDLQLTQATEQVSVTVKNEVMALVERTVTKMRRAVHPTVRSFTEIIGKAKITTNDTEPVQLVSHIVDQKTQ